MPSRKRLPYLIFAIVLIIISLPARLTDWYPLFVVIYVADAVWALMVYLLLAFLFPQTAPPQVIDDCADWLLARRILATLSS